MLATNRPLLTIPEHTILSEPFILYIQEKNKYKKLFLRENSKILVGLIVLIILLVACISAIIIVSL